MLDKARLSELREEVGDSDIAEIVGLFCEEVEETLERLIGAARPPTPDDFHFLKGSALNVGMIQLGALCRSAETALRKDPGATPDIATITVAFRNARAALVAEMSD